MGASKYVSTFSMSNIVAITLIVHRSIMLFKCLKPYDNMYLRVDDDSIKRSFSGIIRSVYMCTKTFNALGWIILFGMGISWIVVGYSNWYLLLLPIAYISFLVKDGRVKKLKRIRKMSIFQVILILFGLVVSVAIVFSLIQLSSYLINEVLHLTGGIKTFSEIMAIILCLYPVKITFGTVAYRVANDLKGTGEGSLNFVE